MTSHRVDARVTGYRDVNIKGARHTAYVLTVRYNGKQWEVEKRYSDFCRTHEYLKLRIDDVAAFDFPRKFALFNAPKQTKDRRLEVLLYCKFIMHALILIHSVRVSMNTCFCFVNYHPSLHN
jgi:hypothetical protein